MAEKSKILEAWIMVEHLSEGDIKLNSTDVYKLGGANGGDCYGFFRRMIEEKLTARRRKNSKKSGGIIVYIDIFDFKNVIRFLREKYHLAAPAEEPRVGTKFGLAVCFDEDLNFLKDMTFFTVSEYIRLKSEIPDESTFRAFEEDLKNELAQSFERSEDDDGDRVYPQKFNAAMAAMIERMKTSAENCRFKVLKNLESDAVNLHSFFVDDLENAKSIDTENLSAYLYGYGGERIDLDSKSSSPKFAPQIFEQILQPANYPLGRFPSCTKFSLSLMQQVAVNLSTGYDDRTIRSVNGPPGTGKTTLLKDIFAELVVRQAAHMTKMTERRLKGCAETVYYKTSSIGELPPEIADNGIVVASSNNGAVQNIVKELPLIKGVDEALTEELKEADYFRELSNCKAVTKWVVENGRKKEDITLEKTGEPDKYWGLFSLEGGRSDNMSAILTNIKYICKYFEEEYVPDEEVYKEFAKEYKAVEKMRDDAEAFADSCKAHAINCEKLRRLESALAEAEQKFAEENAVYEARLAEIISDGKARRTAIESELSEVAGALERIGRDRTQLQSMLDAAKEQKPGFLAGARKKQEYAETVNRINTRIIAAMEENDRLYAREKELRAALKELDISEKSGRQALDASLRDAGAGLEAARRETADLRAADRDFAAKLSAGGKPLDMGLEYDELQLSNPYFGEEYRIAQSRLFISALKVRKQFLAENVKNLKAALNIWRNQNKDPDNKRIIRAAWDWINLAIPVISSTFASFSRMCRNLDENSIGHLFVDEAGQAVPQASVGAIVRSRNVMVVGDPSQIKPVLTLDGSVLKMLGSHFGVDEKYLSENASAQTLVDSAGRYGFYYDDDRSEESWIGIPLWVHRRCAYPMFTISNKISYRDMMVQGNKSGFGKTGWFDVKGRADNKYVCEQGDFLANKISAMMRADPSIGDKSAKDKIYIISPFANVAYMLSRRLAQIGFTRYDDKTHKPTNIGTIHTFQGKEADIVFMVLGADDQSRGAAKWAVDEPNMMNVAATRAKKEFYIVGDRALYQNIGSDVADDTIAVMRRYAKDHPELIDEDVGFMPVQQNVRQSGVSGAAGDAAASGSAAGSRAAVQNVRQNVVNGAAGGAAASGSAAGSRAAVQNARYNGVSGAAGGAAASGSAAGSRAAVQNARQNGASGAAANHTVTAQAHTSSADRVTGRVISVHSARGKESCYAFVEGSDGQRYTISDAVYTATADAENIITEGAQLSFRPINRSEKHYYVDDIEKI